MMQNFRKLFPRKTSIIGMIHVDALPGTPKYVTGSFRATIEKAKHEAEIYKQCKIVSRMKKINETININV